MSFACPSSSDAECSQDTAVNILRKVFGDDYINAFLMQSSPNPALIGDPNTVMSIAASTIASLAITAAILIIIGSIYKWITESANDGEAVGLSERTGLLGFFGRPLFALIMLAPTASGYPLIHIIIMTVVLWSNGAANELYTKFASSRIMPIGSDMSFLKNPAYLKANSVGKAATYGALHGYCAKVSDVLLQTDMKMKVKTVAYNQDGGTTLATQGLNNSFSGWASTLNPVLTEDTYSLYSASGVIPSTTALCGTFVGKNLSENFFKGETPNVTLDNRMAAVYKKIKAVQASNAEVSYKVNSLRRAYAGRAYYEGFLLAYGSDARATVLSPIMNGSDKDISKRPPFYSGYNTYESGWIGWNADPTNDTATDAEIPSTKGIVEIQNRLSATLNEQVGKIISAAANRPNLKIDSEQLRDSLLATGWVNAGNTQSIIRRYTSDNISGLYTKTYETTLALGVKPEDLTANQDMLGAWSTSIDNTQAILLSEVTRDASNPQAISDMGFEADITDLTENPDGKFESLNQKSGSLLTSPLLSLNETLIETMTGTANDNNVDALYRMQSVGETFILMSTAAKVGSVGLKTLLYTKEFTGVLSGAAPVVGEYTENLGEAAGVARKGLTELVLDPLEELLDSITTIGRVFSVIIPSMPYIFLLLAAVGWFVQIVQTMFGMPLWLVMHSIPEKSFIGSQQQGYVTLLSLFFRPILIISAFFLAFVIYDPLVTLFTQGFFQVQSGLSAGTASNTITETLIYIGSLRYWWYLYAGFLMMITYYVFGLVQELADSVLDWVGTNLLKGFGNLETGSTMRNADAGMGQIDAKNATNKQKRALANANDPNNPKPNGGGTDGGGTDGGGGGTDGGGGAGGGEGSLDSVVETRGAQDAALGVVGGLAAAGALGDGELGDNELSSDLDPESGNQVDGNHGMNTTSSVMDDDDRANGGLGGMGNSEDITSFAETEGGNAIEGADNGSEFSAVAAGATASTISDFVGNPVEDGTPVMETDPDTGSITTTSSNTDGSEVSRTTDADGNLISTTASRTNPITGAVASRTENADGSITNALTNRDGSSNSITTDKDDNITQSVFDGNAITTTSTANAAGELVSSSITEDIGNGGYTHTATDANGTSVTHGNANLGSVQSTLHETNADGTVGAIIGEQVDIEGSDSAQARNSAAITGAGLVAAGAAGAAIAAQARNTGDINAATTASTGNASDLTAGTTTPDVTANNTGLNTGAGSTTNPSLNAGGTTAPDLSATPDISNVNSSNLGAAGNASDLTAGTTTPDVTANNTGLNTGAGSTTNPSLNAGGTTAPDLSATPDISNVNSSNLGAAGNASDLTAGTTTPDVTANNTGLNTGAGSTTNPSLNAGGTTAPDLSATPDISNVNSSNLGAAGAAAAAVAGAATSSNANPSLNAGTGTGATTDAGSNANQSLNAGAGNGAGSTTSTGSNANPSLNTGGTTAPDLSTTPDISNVNSSNLGAAGAAAVAGAATSSNTNPSLNTGTGNGAGSTTSTDSNANPSLNAGTGTGATTDAGSNANQSLNAGNGAGSTTSTGSNANPSLNAGTGTGATTDAGSNANQSLNAGTGNGAGSTTSTGSNANPSLNAGGTTAPDLSTTPDISNVNSSNLGAAGAAAAAAGAATSSNANPSLNAGTGTGATTGAGSNANQSLNAGAGNGAGSTPSTGSNANPSLNTGTGATIGAGSNANQSLNAGAGNGAGSTTSTGSNANPSLNAGTGTGATIGAGSNANQSLNAGTGNGAGSTTSTDSNANPSLNTGNGNGTTTGAGSNANQSLNAGAGSTTSTGSNANPSLNAGTGTGATTGAGSNANQSLNAGAGSTTSTGSNANPSLNTGNGNGATTGAGSNANQSLNAGAGNGAGSTPSTGSNANPSLNTGNGNSAGSATSNYSSTSSTANPTMNTSAGTSSNANTSLNADTGGTGAGSNVNRLAGGESSASVRMFGDSNSASSNLNAGGILPASAEQLEQANKKKQTEVSLNSGVKPATANINNISGSAGNTGGVPTSSSYSQVPQTPRTPDANIGGADRNSPQSNAGLTTPSVSNESAPASSPSVSNESTPASNSNSSVERTSDQYSQRPSEGSINNPPPRNPPENNGSGGNDD